MRIQLQTFKSYKTKPILPERTHTLDWETEFVPKMIKHEYCHRKDDVDLLVMARFKPGGTRCTADIEKYTGLVLDIDDGFKIEEFIEQFEKYEYLLHTSFSHSKDTHRFRVIIPFKEEVDIKDYIDAKPLFLNIFPFVDPLCFSPAQSFYLPSCKHTRFFEAKTHHNKGEPFDMATIATRLTLVKQMDEVQKVENTAKEIDEKIAENPIADKQQKWSGDDSKYNNSYERAKEIVFSTDPGLPYLEWIMVGMSLRTMYGDMAFQLWDDWSYQDDKYPDDQDLTWKKWQTFSVKEELSNCGWLTVNSRDYPMEEDE